MTSHPNRTLFLSLTAILIASSLLAQAIDVPLHNWTVPPFLGSRSEGIHTMTDVTGGNAFVGIQPCRVADTRGNGAPITGGIFPNSGLRTWDLTGICGLPGFVQAVSVNFTVVSAAGIPAGSFLLAFPTGQAPPPTAIMTYGPNQVLSNAAIVPLGPNEQMNVNVSGSTHVIMDVNGYFPVVYNNGTSIDVEGNVAGGNMMFVGNFALSGVGGHGILALGPQDTDTAGVKGIINPQIGPADTYFAAGVRGEGTFFGVLGIAGAFLGGGDGVAGSLINGAGHEIAYGTLGSNNGVDAGSGHLPPWGVFAGGNFGATGVKDFIDPHPTDPRASIAYTSLEGPEAGTYFRGRSKFQNGMARIPVPEHFRFVTDPEGLTVQITPIGDMASFAVVTMNLNEIVVKASRNVEFSYLVQGVRATFKDTDPIRSVGDFMPRTADSRMPEWLSPAQKRLLVQNGTYREDGTVNTETAQRLGWDRVWEERARTAPQPAQP